MAFWDRLFRSKSRRISTTADIHKTLQDAQPILELREKTLRTTTKWEGKYDSFEIKGTKNVRTPGLGAFQMISFTATITRSGDGYKWHILAGCIPLAKTASGKAATLEKAKEACEEQMAAMACTIAMVSKHLPKK